MEVINIENCLPDCKLCRRIEKDQLAAAQKIAIFFKTDTLERRKLHNFNHLGVLGIVKSIRKDDAGKIYSVKFENGVISEFILSSIEKIILACDECAKKYCA